MKQVEFKAEVMLTKEEVELAVKQYVTANMPQVDAESVRLNIGVATGDNPGIPQFVFQDAVVVVKPKPVAITRVGTATICNHSAIPPQTPKG